MKTPSLDDTLKRWEVLAGAADDLHQPAVAKLVRDIVQSVRESAADYLTFLSEPDAKLRSGRALRWLRERYPVWEASGDAYTESGRRYYRQCVVPTSKAIREAARKSKRKQAAPDARQRALASVRKLRKVA